ncbi:phage shock protein C [Virgibacillus natechei]|uniref:Phage shock protein C n=1 Tax=Virgibacillus natechei TaxID=1216297 RepID=A0ABS4IEP1_9BACI|nr:PspC domain-containing protein [Virgibacillus natechei]MBP1969407.1 phage shock protein C [Virgibacillus natechei]UZD11879.1 PspC domain-containing protein [Virgibacillus natechei]
MKKLYRSNTNRMVAGILGGLAEYFNIDATIMRLAFVILLFMSIFTFALIYLVAIFIIPNEREIY